MKSTPIAPAPPVTRFASAEATTVKAIVQDNQGDRDMATTTLERPTVQTREGGAELVQGRYRPDSYRTTARIVGVLFLAGFVVGIVGNGLIQSILGAPNHLATVSAN